MGVSIQLCVTKSFVTTVDIKLRPFPGLMFSNMTFYDYTVGLVK